MRAGKLRHTISVTEPVVTGQNSFGEDIISNSNVGVGEFPCVVERLEGRELQIAMQRWARARYKITLRHQGVAFSPKMTATWEGRTLDILDVNDVEGSMRPEVVIYAQDHEG